MITLRYRPAAEHRLIVVYVAIAPSIRETIDVLVELACMHPVKLECHIRDGDLDAVDFGYDAVYADGVAFDPRVSAPLSLY